MATQTQQPFHKNQRIRVNAPRLKMHHMEGVIQNVERNARGEWFFQVQLDNTINQAPIWMQSTVLQKV